VGPKNKDKKEGEKKEEEEEGVVVWWRCFCHLFVIMIAAAGWGGI